MSKTLKYFDGLTWDTITWKTSYEKVRSIQKRIFKASRSDEKEKMWFLQKLLLRNPHAKLIAVKSVNTILNGVKKVNVDNKISTSTKDDIQLIELAKSLNLNGKVNPMLQSFMQKNRMFRKQPVNKQLIQELAKQALCKLVLEPEWEAKFELHSYGFRNEKSNYDSIETIKSILYSNVDKYVYVGQIKNCFEKLEHESLIKKLNTFPLMREQITSWLKTGILNSYPNLTEYEHIKIKRDEIDTLLFNIALHGLEEHLINSISDTKSYELQNDKTTRFPSKECAIGVVRYRNDFVIIQKNLRIVHIVKQETKNWLEKLGLTINDKKAIIKLASQSFEFLDFHITYLKIHNTFQVKIMPNKSSINRITEQTREIIQCNKAVSAYQLIERLRPIILNWATYFQFSDSKEIFSKVDHIIFQQLRSWVFRRSIRQGRKIVKEHYFPSNMVYKFQNREYRANWVLTGTKKIQENKSIIIYLPKISWIRNKNFLRTNRSYSLYDANENYFLGSKFLYK